MRRTAGQSHLVFLLLTLAALSCRTAAPAPTHRPVPSLPSSFSSLDPLTPAQSAWVEKTFERLDLDHKAAQVVFAAAAARPRNVDSEEDAELGRLVSDLGVGGLVLFRSELGTVAPFLNGLQQAADVPLLVSADLERGLAFRVDEGSVQFPDTMAFGALASGGEDAARFLGEVTAREARAVGIHWLLSPVADVNNNPANPVINTRSFGQDPAAVGRLVSAFIAGAHAATPPALTSAKHFPGHGDTAVDSHLELPILGGDRARLESVELVPFRAAILAGVDSVMLGHLETPAIDATGAPATQSRLLATGLLRDELRFRGLVVTDAMNMKGLGDAWPGAAAVRALAAGADVLLVPTDPRVAVQSIGRGVREGILPEARLDDAVRRVLSAKARLGLLDGAAAWVDPAAVKIQVGRLGDQARADGIARSAITLVQARQGSLPLPVEQPLRLLHLVAASDWVGGSLGSVVDSELDQRRVSRETRRLAPGLSEVAIAEIAELSRSFTHVLVSSHVRVGSGVGRIDMDPTHAALIARLGDGSVPTIVVSFGSPYVLTQFPKVHAYLCAWGASSASQKAAVAAIFGEIPMAGHLPVSLATADGVFPVGHGLERPRRSLGLDTAESAAAAGFTEEGLAEVRRRLDAFVAEGAFPGGVLAVGHRGKLAVLHPFGRLSYAADSPSVSVDTVYDLASLTKVVATTTMAMMMVDEGRLDLDKPVQSYLPRFVGSGKEKVTVRHLLTHSSGIDWWAPLYQDTQGWAAFVEKIQGKELAFEPGTQTKYSDLGVILLGEILQRVSGLSLEEFSRRRLFEPLGMSSTGYRPLLGTAVDRIAPTENDSWRGRVLQGEVHDENAFAIGGVAPHAGLFGTASDLARFAQMLLQRGIYDSQRLVSQETVDLFTRRADLVPGSSRALGWDTKSTLGSSAGLSFSEQSFGHTGFTGTSMWMDPTRDLFVILLTNRVHPTRDNIRIREVRPAIADAVVRALIDSTPHAVARRAPFVRVGLDALIAPGTSGTSGTSGDIRRLRSARIGLVVHAASVTADGRHAIDALHSAGFQVVRLFSPEHGLQGRAAAGEEVADDVDLSSGLPIVSLYGERWRPRAEDLAGLDALVFDLQDAGVRFYTYGSTLLGCLQSAAEAGVEVVVLDRPNPLGGELVEGPVAAPRSVVKESAVNRLPGPLVHGLTLGEMARLLNSQAARSARLTVIPMEGWQRAMTWADTARPWIAPSPNLRSPDAALAYPGIALLEGSNVSEGRGSDAPFLLWGAPWMSEIEPLLLLQRIGPTPGFALTPTRFTTRSSSAAPSPKYRDEESIGFRVEVLDAHAAEPYRLGVAIVRAVAAGGGFAWDRDGASLTWLLGTAELLERLRRGLTVDEIVAADAADHAAWRATRKAFLLYDSSPNGHSVAK